MSNVALITGGAGGLGIALTRRLASNGWRVFAADRDRDGLKALEGQAGITPIYLDVTDSNSVQAAFNTVAEQVSCLTAVVNFAGILRVGALIEVDEETVRQVLDINLMGTYRVNQAFFPLLTKAEQRGRIVNLSSETGWHTASPFNGPYAMSKYGVEAYSDALRRELSILDVPVICVQPGPFKTRMVEDTVAAFHSAAQDSQYYAAQLNKFGDLVYDANQKSQDPELLAQVIHTALTARKPKHRYSVKADRGRSFLEWLPMSLADRLFRKLLTG